MTCISGLSGGAVQYAGEKGHPWKREVFVDERRVLLSVLLLVFFPGALGEGM